MIEMTKRFFEEFSSTEPHKHDYRDTCVSCVCKKALTQRTLLEKRTSVVLDLSLFPLHRPTWDHMSFPYCWFFRETREIGV